MTLHPSPARTSRAERQAETDRAATLARTGRPVQVFVATSNGPRYAVIGVGLTPEQAKAAAFSAWRRQRRPVPGVPLATVEAFADYFGLGVYGPLGMGEGASE